MQTKGYVKWPLLTCVLQSVNRDVQTASIDVLWGWDPPRYYVKVEPYSHEFWRIFKLKFPDWIVHAKRYRFDHFFSLYTPRFYSVSDLIAWLSDTIRRPGVRSLLLLECAKYNIEARVSR